MLASADLGIRQHDASWRHIGWYKYNGENKLKIFDFGHVDVVRTREEKQLAFEYMLDQLNQELIDSE